MLTKIDMSDVKTIVTSVKKIATGVRSLEALTGKEKDKDGNPIEIPRKAVVRTWTCVSCEGEEGKEEVEECEEDKEEVEEGEKKVEEGEKKVEEFTAMIFVPADRDIKGCAFFMHGFSQSPRAYYSMLKNACETAKVAIIAVETNLTSKCMLTGTIKSAVAGASLEYVLQHAVVEDTVQLIEMLNRGDGAFDDFGISKSAVGNRIAVMGHCMGGGLSFRVAARCHIDYVFTMAPSSVAKAFDPITEGLEKRTPKESMLLAGWWDLIAHANKVKEISATANSKITDSSVLVNIKHGLHTGFEDELMVFDIPADNVLKGAGIVSKIFGFGDIIVLKAINFAGNLISSYRTRTGQIKGSSLLMSYFLSEMTAGESITVEKARKYLDGKLEEEFEEKFVFTYGGADGK